MMMLAVSTPDPWSPRAALCLCGIAYMVLLSIYIIRKGPRGFATIALLWAISVVIMIGISPTHPGQSMEERRSGKQSLRTKVKHKGRWVDAHKLIYDENKAADYNDDSVIYTMHDRSESSYIDPWIFHPGMFFWCPLIIGGCSIIAFTQGRKG